MISTNFAAIFCVSMEVSVALVNLAHMSVGGD